MFIAGPGIAIFKPLTERGAQWQNGAAVVRNRKFWVQKQDKLNITCEHSDSAAENSLSLSRSISLSVSLSFFYLYKWEQQFEIESESAKDLILLCPFPLREKAVRKRENTG